MAKKQGINIVPLGDRVVVRRESAEETTAGGIVLPDSAQASRSVARSLPWATGTSSQTATRSR